MMPWSCGDYGMMGAGWILMLSFWVLIILAVLAAVRWFGASLRGRDAARRTPPLDILKERYSRGEIEKEEYEQKRRDLEL